jgi:hypothetical protein
MPRKPEPPKRPSRISVPVRCHPMAKLVFAEMQRQNVTYDSMEHYSGVLRSTLKAWRTHNKPGLETIEAAFGVLGWAVLPVPRLKELPPEIQAGLEELAAKWEGINPTLHQLLATVSRIPIMGEFARLEQAVVVVAPNRRRGREPHPDQVTLFEVAA